MLKNCEIEIEEITDQPQVKDSILANGKILADEIIRDVLENNQETK